MFTIGWRCSCFGPAYDLGFFMREQRTLLIVAAFIASALPVWAQRDRSYDSSVVSQVRIDLRELGYPPVDVIPSDESAIRALAVDNNAQGYEHYVGGHLLKYVPAEDTARNGNRIEKACPVVDLGIPFFSYQIRPGALKIQGRVARKIIPGEKIENEKAIGRALALDQDGNVFTSGEGGRFCRFDIKAQRLEHLEIGVPAVPGREVYNRVDAWTADLEGSLYGGSSDGYLFRLNPAKLAVVNLGKPLNQYRIRGLVLAHNGKIYGMGGDDDEMARLFSYDPASGLYELLGMIDVNRRPYYSWQGYVFDAMVLGLDGTVYMGQAERKSKLYLYYPQ